MADQVGGSIVWNLDVDDSKLTSGLKDAKNEVKDTAKEIDNSLSGSLDRATKNTKKFALAFAGVVTSLGLGVGFGVKIAGDLEAARQGFVALLGSAEKADETLSRIKKEAAATPFELTGLISNAQAMTAITKNGNKAVDVLLDVGKAIATSGKGQNELDRVIQNLQSVASTGVVNEIDIRQFQNAIPIFNDIIASAGLTTEELKNSANAADLLFGAFQKAGAEGGITSQGFVAQAGTFNQQISNLKDNVTILSSELVKQTGIFDFLKQVLSTVNGVLGDNQRIIDMVKGAFSALGSVFTTFILPPLRELFAVINAELLPELRELWSLVSPVLIPALKILAQIVGALLVVALRAAIEVLKTMISWLSTIIGWVNQVLQVFKDIVNFFFSDTWKRIGSAIVQPFKDAFNWLKDNANKIKDTIKNAFDPTQKHSPSLVDNVMSGVKQIKQAYQSLQKMDMPAMSGISSGSDASSIYSLSTAPAIEGGLGGSRNEQNIDIQIGQVSSQQDVESLVRELGYRIAIAPQSTV